MKLKTTIIALVAILAVAKGQLAQAANHQVPGATAQPDTYFYTGKPYDQDMASYIFAVRYYNPALSRWTSADPSKFPDGINNNLYVSNSPTNLFDDFGLTNKSIAWIMMGTTYTLSNGIVINNMGQLL